LTDFWRLAIDKIQCLFQGRPPLLRQINFKASLDFLDEYDELDSFQDITYKSAHQGPTIPSLNVSLLTKLCELSTITERILCELYSESQSMSPRQSQKISKDINSDLSKWRQSLPPQLDYLLHPNESVLLPQAFCLLYDPSSPHPNKTTNTNQRSIQRPNNPLPAPPLHRPQPPTQHICSL
jgi:hypothetical protein